MEIQYFEDTYSGATYTKINNVEVYCTWDWEDINGLHIEYLNPITDEVIQYIIHPLEETTDKEQFRKEEILKIYQKLFGSLK